jgi:hypothetical protein
MGEIMLIQSLIKRWQRRRILRAVRLLVNNPLIQSEEIQIAVAIEDKCLIVTSGSKDQVGAFLNR